jgi:hypothetical protein
VKAKEKADNMNQFGIDRIISELEKVAKMLNN